MIFFKRVLAGCNQFQREESSTVGVCVGAGLSCSCECLVKVFV